MLFARVMSRWWAILFILGIFLVSALVPHEWFLGHSLCYIKSLSGLECPGCGLTRAFSLFFKGHWYQAVAINALVPVLVLWFLIYLTQHIIEVSGGEKRQWFTPQGNRWIARLFLILFVGQCLWKNIMLFWH